MAVDPPADTPYTIGITQGHWAGGPTEDQMNVFSHHLQRTLVEKFGEVHTYLKLLYEASGDQRSALLIQQVNGRVDQVESDWAQERGRIEAYLAQSCVVQTELRLV